VSREKIIKARAKRRKYRVRDRLQSKGIKLRISVFRSNKNISAQIIDDAKGKTVASFSSANLEKREGDKTAVAKTVGKELGKKAMEQGIEHVFFDRGPFLFHGRVKALAEGLRESGLKF
jgi:large subunit ribosomal protein L18